MSSHELIILSEWVSVTNICLDGLVFKQRKTMIKRGESCCTSIGQTAEEIGLDFLLTGELVLSDLILSLLSTAPPNPPQTAPPPHPAAYLCHLFHFSYILIFSLISSILSCFLRRSQSTRCCCSFHGALFSVRETNGKIKPLRHSNAMVHVEGKKDVAV